MTPDATDLIQRAGSGDLAAVTALGSIRSVEAADALDAIDHGNGDKALRKEARRSLARLRSFGIRPGAPPPVAADAPVLAAQASSYDPAGGRTVCIYVRSSLGGVRMVAAAINEFAGARESIVRPLSTSLDRELANPWIGKVFPEKLTWIRVAPEYAAWLIRRAAKLNPKLGTSIPVDFVEVSNAIRVIPETEMEPGIYAHVRPVEAKLDPSLLAESGKLFEEPELMRQGFEPTDLVQYAREIDEIAAGAILIGSRQQRIAQVFDRAHQAMFTREAREGYARVLQETALIFWNTHRQRSARRAVAAAVALTESNRPNPFSRLLIEGSMGIGSPLLDERDDRLGEASSGLWLPPR